MEKKKKRYFAKHAKSSAITISIVIHLIFLLVALSFVAVKVIARNEQQFEVKQVKRPQMKLRKLVAPVKMERKRKPKPKLRKRILVQKKVNLPKIKLPEISGIKGGTGYLDGEGGLGSLGFEMDIDFFGIMGGGDHIVFIIDYSESMKGDKDKIMRREAARVIRALPHDTQFGVIFFSGPAWSASKGLKGLDDWVWTKGNYYSFRPKDWNNMPVIKYKQASRGVTASMAGIIESTPLAPGTVYDCPIYMALKMSPLPDTIFFMTDGACPTRRGIVSLRKMVSQLKAEGKKVPKMHTVGFGIKNDAQLRAMADLMGGESNFLTVKDYIKEHGPNDSKPSKRKPKVNVRKGVTTAANGEYPVEFSL